MADNSSIHKAFGSVWTAEDQAIKDRRYANLSRQEVEELKRMTPAERRERLAANSRAQRG